MTTVGYAVAVALGLVGAMLGLIGLSGVTGVVHVPWLLPPAGLELSLDPLGALFLLLIGLSVVPASVYAMGYHRGAGGGLAYVAFVASMLLVPLAANVLTFLVVWELMALASYALVLGHGDSPAGERAAWIYAVMTHAGLACLMAGMLLVAAATGSLRFADWAGAVVSPGLRDLAFVLLLLGFAGKAGVIPLHVWLPLAHPEAPSHVSALLSGVMIKLGVYGLLRIGFEWLGPGPAWWGVVLLLAGTASALVGVLYALVDNDLKRLLAFSSIENVGIILMGVGAALCFRAAGLAGLAVLGLAAALYHTVHHAAFKALLFLAAGAVVRATGTRDMEAMGGLVKRMPWTAACFLVGAVSIAALPPLNGFVSEWLTFQALLQTARIPRPEINLAFVLGLAGLALTGGLAAACFVRAYGIAFLALPRSPAAEGAREAPWSMRLPMVGVAAACAALGLGATVVLPVLGRLAAIVLRVPERWARADSLSLRVPGDFGALSPVTVALAIGVAFAAVPILLALVRANRGTRGYETWACGRLLQTARMEYTATAFSNPFKRVFGFVYRPVKRLDIDFHPESRFFVRTIEYRNETRSVFDEWFYAPLVGGLRVVTTRVRGLQSGSINVYLGYILAILLALLVLM